MGALISTASSEKNIEISDNSILRINLDYAIKERTEKNPFNNVNIPSFSSEKTIGLDEILRRIEAAKKDDRIKGIILDINGVGASFATLQEIRNALLNFKQSKNLL